MYICPVCGYDQLRKPPANFVICPSCGTEFGYSDAAKTFFELQVQWLLNGAPWHSNVVEPPLGWNAYSQITKLASLGLFTPTVTTSAEIEVSGKVVPSTKARTLSTRVVWYGQLSDLVANTPPIHVW